jgi:hypothetical protein
MKRVRLGAIDFSDVSLLVSLGFAKRKHGPGMGGLFGAPAPLEITDAGLAFDDAANVYYKKDEARRLLREAYMRLPVTQALIQGLHGRGPIPVDGALYLLARHGLAHASRPREFRAMLGALNAMGVVAYSPKLQTVRVVSPMPSGDEGDPVPDVRIIEPDRPFSNVRHVREVLRRCRDFIWWADVHFEKRGLELLADEADMLRINEIRVLMVTRPKPTEFAEYQRFTTEMGNLGITAEIRVVAAPDRDFHDRFIIGKGEAWNVPPLNTVFKGDYSQLARTDAPPFEKWWLKGVALGDL